MGANIKGPYSLQEVTTVGATTTKNCVITNSTATGYALNVVNAAANGYAVYIEQSTADHTTGVLLYVTDTRAGSTKDTAYIVNSGTGNVLTLSSTTGAFRMPIMTSAQRAAIGNAAGRMVYDTDLNQICINTGAKWQKITGVADC